MSKLAALRAKILEQEPKTSTNKPRGDQALYPFWNIKIGETAVLRFLPDADPTNALYWVEKAVINLPFTGLKSDPSDEKVRNVVVPCIDMYGEKCPIIAELSTWYKPKDPVMTALANKYWKKRTYIFQGFVRSNPLIGTGDPKTEDSPPENPIRRFVIAPQLYTVIKAGNNNPEIEEIPTDYENGLNFNVLKGKSGEHADYSTSSFARRESALTEADHAAIEKYGLFNLKDFLPRKPSESELRVIKEMFEASVDGRPYDLEKWGAYYKPWGLDAPANGSDDDESFETQSPRASAPRASAPAQETPQRSSTPPWNDDAEEDAFSSESVDKVEASTSEKLTTSDILAKIKARQAKPA
jgi:hypothetical protein